MKKKHYRPSRLASAVIVTALLGLSACSDDMPEVFIPDSGKIPLEFRATIDQESASRADESGFADGDRFGAFVVNYKDGQPGSLTLKSNQVNNVAIRYNADSNTWTPATDIYWLDDQTRADVYGYYPFNNALADVDSYSFEVSRDQSIPSADGEMGSYEASDFLWAKTPAAKPGEKVSLSFGHALAGVKVELQKGSGFEGNEWEELPKTVTVDNTIRTASVNLSTGGVTPAGSPDRNIVMNPEAEAWRAVVVPQTVAAGKSVIGVTIDGAAYSLTRSDAMTYSPGKLHNFTISVDKNNAAGDYSLKIVNEAVTPWEADMTSHNFEDNAYISVHCPEPGKLREVLVENKINFNTLRNLKVSGQLTTEDFYLMRDELRVLAAVNLKDIRVKDVRRKEWLKTGPWIDEVEDDMIPDEAFSGKRTLRRLILPDNIKKIGYRSFYKLSLTSTVIIPESVRVIDAEAFNGIAEGAVIVMPHHLEVIGKRAFSGCNADMEIILTNTVRYIGDGAFAHMSNLHGKIAISDKLEYLGERAFYYCQLEGGEIVIPPTITEIPAEAFYGVYSNRGIKVVLHDGITKIGESAFYGFFFAPGFSLPKNLKEIGKEAFSYSRFTDELILPESIELIGQSAFESCYLRGSMKVPVGMEVIPGYCFMENNYENIVIGDNIEMINEGAFSFSRSLSKVEIGKNVNYINTYAFSDCYGLTTMICLAKDPPRLSENTLTGIDPLHCHLEVPEESVDLYKAAEGWRDFRFISPHRELTIGIHDQECLNKGLTRSVILYSEGPWRVKSAPSWIHVTPDHADYMEEITFKVDPLSVGAGTREGKVVFELVGKDYTTECEFRQYDYSYDEDKPIELQKATAGGKAVNLFIVGDGFGASEIVNGNYLDRMNETMEHFFAIEPYKTYRKYFNVSTSIAMSPDNNVTTLQNGKLDRLNTVCVELDAPAVMDYAKKYSGTITSSNIKYAMIIVLSNMEAFEGSAIPDQEGCALACVSLSPDIYPYDFRGLVQHYAGGQAFAGLAVEYVTHHENVNGCKCSSCNDIEIFRNMKAKGLFENVSLSGKMSDAPWSRFIFHPKYSAMVDMWEGGHKHLGVWRSEPQSVMGTYISYYNTISRYAIYKAIMRRAGLKESIDDFIANDKIELP